MDTRVGVRGEDIGLGVEPLHVAEIERDSDVVTRFARVLGVRRRRPVLDREEADEDERLGELPDFATDLLTKRASDLGGIDHLCHGTMGRAYPLRYSPARS